mgnify:CR=1 FL=1
MSKLYAITDSQLMPGQLLFDGVTAALQGGCRLVQYRDKSGDAEKRRKEAEGLLEICRHHGAHLIINDDPLLAHAIGADGVHLGQSDGDARAARQLLGPDAIVGITCHASLDFAQQALLDGASYIAFGRFFPSQTKPDAPPAPLSLINEAIARYPDTQVVAVGGITLENAATIIQAGAHYIAVSHALFNAPDIRKQAEQFSKL